MQNIPQHYLHTIHQYEVTIKRPWSEQIVRKHNRYYTLRVNAPVEDIITYSQQCQKYLNYCNRVQTFHHGITAHNLGRNQLKVEQTPEYLLNLGFDQLPILYGQTHFILATTPTADKAMQDKGHNHDLDLDIIKQFAELLDHPTFIADSMREPDSLLIGLNQVDKKGKTLIAYIKPSVIGYVADRGTSENQLATVFGKDNFPQFYQRLSRQGKIIWKNEKMCRTPGRISKHQFLGDYPQLGTSDTSLRIPECIVNKYQEGVLAVTPEIETRINKQLHPQLSVQNIATRLNNIVTSSSIKPSMMKPQNRFTR